VDAMYFLLCLSGDINDSLKIFSDGTSIISALGRWKQEDHEFQASLSYIDIPCHKNKILSIIIIQHQTYHFFIICADVTRPAHIACLFNFSLKH
jgi:hypothetical protein